MIQINAVKRWEKNQKHFCNVSEIISPFKLK